MKIKIDQMSLRPTVGNVYTLVKSSDLNSGEISYSLDSKGGARCNMDRSIRKTKGWIGTTNDIEEKALGLYKITAVEETGEGWDCKMKAEKCNQE